METFTIKTLEDFEKVLDELIPNKFTGVIQTKKQHDTLQSLVDQVVPESFVHAGIRLPSFPIKIHYENGIISKKDGPAVEYVDPDNYVWIQNGILHNDNGPTIKVIYPLDLYFIKYNKLIKHMRKEISNKQIIYYKNNMKQPTRSIYQNTFHGRSDMWHINYYVGNDLVKQIDIDEDKLLKIEPDVEYIL